MSDPTCLTARHLTAGYGQRVILDEVNLSFPTSKVTGIIGPNGCGKSTLLKALSGVLPTTGGEVLLNTRPLTQQHPREVARALALLPQTPTAPAGMTVRELALHGRAPHQPWYRSWSPEDEQIVGQALRDTGMQEMAARMLEDLSGGQRQRAWIALALAQQAPVMMLDEPTSHLDLAHAVDVMELLVRLRTEAERTVIVVLHDLTLAARFCDELVVMHHGSPITQGPPARVLTSALLKDVFGLNAHVFSDPYEDLVTVVPSRRACRKTPPPD